MGGCTIVSSTPSGYALSFVGLRGEGECCEGGGVEWGILRAERNLWPGKKSLLLAQTRSFSPYTEEKTKNACVRAALEIFLLRRNACCAPVFFVCKFFSPVGPSAASS